MFKFLRGLYFISLGLSLKLFIMKYFGIIMNLGDTSFGVPKKNVLTEPSALLAGSAIAGGASLLGSVLGITSQSAANKANLQIARENNAAQYQMFKEANAFNRQERLEAEKFNRSMLREQQLFNSPAAQAERLAAAGLNAGNIMDGNSAQAVTSVPSSSPASSVASPSLQGAHIEPVFNASDTAALASSFSAAVKQLQEANALSIDNQTRMQKNIEDINEARQRIASMLENRNLSRVQRHLLETQDKGLAYQNLITKFNLDHQQDSWRMTNEQHNAMMQQFGDQHNQATLDYKRAELAYNIEAETGLRLKLGELRSLNASISKAYAEIGLLGAQEHLTEYQAKTEVERMANIVADSVGKRLDNEGKAKVRHLVVADLESQIRQRNASAGLSELGTSTLGVISKLAPFVPVGLGAFGAIGKGYKYLKGLRHLKKVKVEGNTITWK